MNRLSFKSKTIQELVRKSKMSLVIFQLDGDELTAYKHTQNSISKISKQLLQSLHRPHFRTQCSDSKHEYICNIVYNDVNCICNASTAYESIRATCHAQMLVQVRNQVPKIKIYTKSSIWPVITFTPGPLNDSSIVMFDKHCLFQLTHRLSPKHNRKICWRRA